MSGPQQPRAPGCWLVRGSVALPAILPTAGGTSQRDRNRGRTTADDQQASQQKIGPRSFGQVQDGRAEMVPAILFDGLANICGKFESRLDHFRDLVGSGINI